VRSVFGHQLVVQSKVSLDHGVEAEILHYPCAACRTVGLAEGRIREIGRKRLLQAVRVRGAVQTSCDAVQDEFWVAPTLPATTGSPVAMASRIVLEMPSLIEAARTRRSRASGPGYRCGRL